MYTFANEKHVLEDLLSTEIRISKSYLQSCPFILRGLAVIIGLICIVLVSTGYEHDFDAEAELEEKNSDSYTIISYSGYGVGYKSEILTRIFLALIIICFIVSVAYLTFLIFVHKASTDWKLANKCAYISMALIMIAATVCGGFGLEYFRENCCRIRARINATGFNYMYFNSSQDGYSSACLCTLTTESLIIFDAHKWNANYSDLHIKSASPHHQHIHASSVLMAFVNCIMYLVAFFFP